MLYDPSVGHTVPCVVNPVYHKQPCVGVPVNAPNGAAEYLQPSHAVGMWIISFA